MIGFIRRKKSRLNPLKEIAVVLEKVGNRAKYFIVYLHSGIETHRRLYEMEKVFDIYNKFE